MKRIRDLLVNNLFWKLASLVLAVLVWFLVLNNADPVKTRQISVPLTINNEDKLKENGRILVNGEDLANTTVKVNVRGNTKDLDALEKSSTGITASVDVNLLEIYSSDDEYTTEINVVKSSLYSDIEIVSKSPTTITIQTERYVTEEKTVTVNFTGTQAEGYLFVAESVAIEPSTVTVSGPISAMQKVSKVAVDINIEGMSEDVTDEAATPVAYNSLNEKIENIDITSTVSYTATAFKLGTLEINEPDYVGEPADGYVVTGDPYYSPQTVQVMGEEEAINNLTPVTLEPYDISGATETVSTEYSLRAYLPNNVDLVNRDIGIIEVEFTIEQLITKTFTIAKKDLNITGFTSGTEIMAESVEVTLVGVASVINDEATTLTAHINLEGLEVGEHEVPVNFTYPNGLELVGDVPYVTVVITTTEAADEETSTDTVDESAAPIETEGEAIVTEGVDENSGEDGDESGSE